MGLTERRFNVQFDLDIIDRFKFEFEGVLQGACSLLSHFINSQSDVT